MTTIEKIKHIQKNKNCSIIEAKRVLDKAGLLFDIHNAKTINDLKLIIMKLIDLTL
jgi:hypothetical protein